jgi:predicted acylesterase/phospholipase RssA
LRKILSIRGGGIRGIIPCCCLVGLESQLGGVTRDHIDFCAGTSTGALLTAAIAAGIPASDLLKVYTERAQKIFTPTGAVASAKRVVEGFMYEPTHLHDVLVSVFAEKADWAINASPIRVMISATAMNGHNWFFVKDNPRNTGVTGRIRLLDAAVASACAPTYFDHWKIDNIEGKTLRFFDGGVGGTANPAYEACVEAFEYDDFTPADTRVVALGTGFFPAPDDPPSGLLGTIGWSTSTLVDTSADWVDQAVNRQWPGVMMSQNILLPREIDEADISAIGDLVTIGKTMAAGLDWAALLNPVTLNPVPGEKPAPATKQ